MSELEQTKKLIIIGGGTSINEGIELGLWEKIKGNTIWSLNYSFMTMPYLPTRELWVDRKFFKINMNSLNDLANKKVEMVGMVMTGIPHIPLVTSYIGTRNYLDYRGKEGIKNNRIFIGQQGFTGMFALHIAICEGYNDIYLLGYDFGVPKEEISKSKTHYYQDKIKVASTGVGRPEVYLGLDGKVNEKIKDFEVFLKEENVKIWNVSLKSNINYYEKISYEVFFKCLQANL